jgi:hypothetical protein
MIYIPQRIELADGKKCVALEDYDKLATENMLEVNAICKQRDEAINILSKLSHVNIVKIFDAKEIPRVNIIKI